MRQFFKQQAVKQSEHSDTLTYWIIIHIFVSVSAAAFSSVN